MISAVFLSVVTLGVFAVQTDNGPEGAVKRLHLRIAKGDGRLALTSTTEPDAPASVTLLNMVADFVRRGAQIQQVVTDANQRTQDRALVIVQYSFPDGREGTMLFVAVKARQFWLVDARATITLLWQLSQPGNGLN